MGPSLVSDRLQQDPKLKEKHLNDAHDVVLEGIITNQFLRSITGLIFNTCMEMWGQRVHDNSSKTILQIRQLVAYHLWSMRRFAEYDKDLGQS